MKFSELKPGDVVEYKEVLFDDRCTGVFQGWRDHLLIVFDHRQKRNLAILKKEVVAITRPQH